MEEENSNDCYLSTLANAVEDLEPSLHTLKQRRWRANNKTKSSFSASETLQQYTEDNTIDLHSSSSGEDSDCTQYDDEVVIHKTDWNAMIAETDESNVFHDLDTPLYAGAPVTCICYHKEILDFINFTRLDQSNVNKLLKLIGKALPLDNKLVKSYNKLVSMFQNGSSFNESLRCAGCLELIDKTNVCSILCSYNGCQRRTSDVIEHLSVNNSDKQLIDVIQRNKHLIIEYPQVVAKIFPCDVLTGLVYRKKTNQLQSTSDFSYQITLMLHIDGTPVVRWSKKHSWLIMGSIVEIPPPLRENQRNMLLFGFWNGPIKPEADLLLKELCDNIKHSLVVDGLTFVVDVQLFKADLPARALATKHNQHNAYYACLECDQKGEWCQSGKVVIYPYEQYSMNLRTPVHFNHCVNALSVQPSLKDYHGVKGISPLLKIIDIPIQVDIDVMHLCFIGHCSLLLSRWEKILIKQAWLKGNELLKRMKWPHDFKIELRSFSDRTYWKAHDYRCFFLYLMFPFAFSFLPEQVSSHFALYFVFLRTLYFYHNFNEVTEVQPLIELYFKLGLPIYGPTFHLYSTHAHLHLTEKVLQHGGLCFHNCFGNEAFIRFIRSLRSGNRLLAHQICRAFDRTRFTSTKENSSIQNLFLDEKFIQNDYLDRDYVLKYREEFLKSIGYVIDSTDNPNTWTHTKLRGVFL